jgi:hypothetical protein
MLGMPASCVHRCVHGDTFPAMRFYGMVCDSLEEAIELFTERREAELVVENWNRDEPERVGELRVEAIEIETSQN